MKHTSILLIILVMCAMSLIGKDIVIENPPFRVSNQSFVEIEKITISDTATVMKMVGYNHPKWWIKIDPSAYIEFDGKKNTVKYAKDIVLGKETYTNEKGELHFTLVFDAIPKETQRITFEEDGSIIRDIELQSKMVTNKTHLPFDMEKLLNIKDDGKSLPIPDFEEGDATLKGQFIGYIPEMKYSISIFHDETITKGREEYTAKVNDDGSFECKVPMKHTMEVLFRVTPFFYNRSIVLSPNKESKMYINLEQKSLQDAHLRVDKTEEIQYVFFEEENAEINNQINKIALYKMQDHLLDYSGEIKKASVGMNAEEYKAYRLDIMNNAIKKLSKMGLTKKAFELMTLRVEYLTIQSLLFARSDLERAYRDANKLKRDDKLENYVHPIFDSTYYSFLANTPINNPISLYNLDYGNMINSCRFIDNSREAITPESFFKITKTKLSAEEKEIFEYAIKKFKTKNDTDSLMERKLNLFFEKYSDVLSAAQNYSDYTTKKEYLGKILGANEGIAFDIMQAQILSEGFDNMTPMMGWQLEKAKSIRPPFGNYLSKKNEKLIAKLEKDKLNPYNVYTIDAEEDKILYEMIKPFEGKVILIDFWATWCGPCRSAMRMFADAKKTFEGKDVAFIYLTDHSSPLRTWENMIPSIGGEHYRLKNEQNNYLKQKFGVKGIPSYLILNKKGEQVHFSVGFPGVDKIKKILNDELEK